MPRVSGQSPPLKVRAYVALAVGVFSLAWSAIFVLWAPIPGSASALYRVLFAALALSPLLVRNRAMLSRRTVALAFAGGAFFAADLSLYGNAILQSSATNATVLGNNTPVFVGLLTWMILGRPPRAAFWIGLSVAIAGSVVIVGGDLLRGANFGAADVLAVASSACFAGYLMVTEELRRKMDTATLLALSLAGSSAALLAYNFAAGVPLRVSGLRAWLALLGLAVVCQLIGYFALTYALGHLSATVTSVSLLAQAPLTAWLAVLVLGDTLAPSQVIGGVLVLAGVWIVNYFGRSRIDSEAAIEQTQT